MSRAVSVLASKHSDIVRGLVPVGNNQVSSFTSTVGPTFKFSGPHGHMSHVRPHGHNFIKFHVQGHMDYLEGNYARSRAVGGARPKVATVEGAIVVQ